MQVLASLLVTASAAIVGVLGALHLLYTFHGTKLLPRESGVRETMESSGLELTQQTTVWRAWIGFNASHSLGALLFGLVVIAAVKNDLALIALATGPFRRFSPDFGPGPPSAANVEIAIDMGKYVESFSWRGDPPR